MVSRPTPPKTIRVVPAARGFSPLILRLLDEQRHGRAVFELDADLVYYGGGIRVHVPGGYKTDFASVPRGLWNFFPPWGRYAKAAVIHDFLCDDGTLCSRFLADAIFRELMWRLGVPWYVRLPVYWAVRIYGFIFRGGA